MREIKTLAGTLVLILLVIGIGYFFFQGRNMCSDAKIADFLSPTGGHVAKLVVRNCGATTDFSTQVTIDDSSVIVIKGDKSKNIVINWKSVDNLSVDYKGNMEDVFKSENSYRDVKIHLIVSKPAL